MRVRRGAVQHLLEKDVGILLREHERLVGVVGGVHAKEALVNARALPGIMPLAPDLHLVIACHAHHRGVARAILHRADPDGFLPRIPIEHLLGLEAVTRTHKDASAAPPLDPRAVERRPQALVAWSRHVRTHVVDEQIAVFRLQLRPRAHVATPQTQGRTWRCDPAHTAPCTPRGPFAGGPCVQGMGAPPAREYQSGGAYAHEQRATPRRAPPPAHRRRALLAGATAEK